MEDTQIFPILLVEQDDGNAALTILALEALLNVQVTRVASEEKALEAISKQFEIAAAVLNVRGLGDQKNELIGRFEFLRPAVPVILTGCSVPESRVRLATHTYINSATDMDAIAAALISALQNVPGGAGLIVPKFCRIKFETLKKFEKIGADLYIKLSDEKFVKTVHRDDAIEPSDIQRFEEKNVHYLYVRRDEIHSVLQVIAREQIADHYLNGVDQEFQNSVSASMLEVVHEVSTKLGFTVEVRALIQKIVHRIVTSVMAHPDLKKLIVVSSVDQKNYIISHGFALAHISCGIASLQQWSSEPIFHKLVFAAILHDITLTSGDLAKVQNYEELIANYDLLTQVERDKVLTHPSDAATTIQHAFPDISEDIIAIVGQHHERPDGTGFPNHWKHTRLFALSSLFIFTHELLHFLDDSRSGTRPNLHDFLRDRHGVYTQGHFKGIAASLRHALGDEQKRGGGTTGS